MLLSTISFFIPWFYSLSSGQVIPKAIVNYRYLGIGGGMSIGFHFVGKTTLFLVVVMTTTMKLPYIFLKNDSGLHCTPEGVMIPSLKIRADHSATKPEIIHQAKKKQKTGGKEQLKERELQ